MIDCRNDSDTGFAMATLTGTQHGDAANTLFAFYQDKASELEDGGQYFMAAVALALALEAAVLTYMLVEFGEENGGELRIPSSVNLSDLIAAANEVDVLGAPIDIPSHIYDEGSDERPKHIARDVIDGIRVFRIKIHPARALKEGFDPRQFGKAQYNELTESYESVMHSLMYYL